jgi:dipeptidase E
MPVDGKPELDRVTGMSRRAPNLLLLSTSTVFGSGYLDYAEEEVREFLGEARDPLFVPFALHDMHAYAARAIERFGRMGYRMRSLHRASDKRAAIEAADAIFVGGGNTFRLLKTLSDFDLLKTIRARVANGMRYMGASAGSNLAGPTIRTTNDMPIVQPPSFDALGLVDFQINPHYADPEPGSQHMGETREERILQFLEENDTPVVGLREGAMIRVEGDSICLKGTAGARVFRKGVEPREISAGSVLAI